VITQDFDYCQCMAETLKDNIRDVKRSPTSATEAAAAEAVAA